MYLKLVELFNYSKNLFNWLLQERDKLLRYRKQRKKMAKIPKVSEGMAACVHVTRVSRSPPTSAPLPLWEKRK